MARGKRAESRCRYLVRDMASQKRWDTSHPQKGGDFLKEQEIEDFLPDCGLSGTKPDFLVCHKNIPLLVVEAKNDRKKISQALKEAIAYSDKINQRRSPYKQWDDRSHAARRIGVHRHRLSPECYLPQPELPDKDQKIYCDKITRSILQTAVCIEDIAGEVIENFPDHSPLPDLPYGTEKTVEELFDVYSGRSKGESSYLAGTCPYISSGDPQNSIVRLVNEAEGEVFSDGGITVTCFGQASVQPWPFMARGNGGSAVRVLIPKYNMNYPELVWFAAQINIQRWRFFYGRMAIQRRIRELLLKLPEKRLQDSPLSIANKISALSGKLSEILQS